MSIKITIAPGRPDGKAKGGAQSSKQLLEIAQAMSDDCDGDPICIVGSDGQQAAVVGRADVDTELFDTELFDDTERSRTDGEDQSSSS